MHRNYEESTPDLVVNNVCCTPSNQNPCLWSPNLNAEVPDLNIQDSECKGTPALIQSLGINQELNVFWSAAMETPIQQTQMSLMGITRLKNPISSDSKIKPLQPRHLFHNEHITNQDKDLGKEMYTSDKEPDLCTEQKTCDSKLPDFFRLLKRPASKFVYPKPIHINIHSNDQPMRCENLKQKYGNKSVNQSVISVDVAPRLQIKGNCNLNGLKKNESVVKDLSTNTSSSVKFHGHQVHNKSSFTPCDFLSTKLSTDDEFLKPLCLQTGEYNTTELISSKNGDEAHCSSNENNKHCETLVSRRELDHVGFNTASGKKFTISEKAMVQAKAKFEEIDKADLFPLNNIPSKFNNLIEKPIPEKLGCSDKMPQNFDDLKTTGFSATKKKTVHVSDEAMTRGRVMFAAASEAPSSNVLESHATVGFSTANGKKCNISEKAMIQARAKLEDFDKEDLVPLKHQKLFHSNEKRVPEENWNLMPHGSDIPNTVGFLSDKGKPIHISDDAMTKGEAIFADLNEAPLLHPSPRTFDDCGKKVAISEESIAQTFLSGFDVGNAVVPKTASFSKANGQNISLSKGAIARGQALLEDVLDTNTENEHGVTPKANRNSVAVSKQALTRSGDSRIRAKTSFKAPRRIIPSPAQGSRGFEITDCNSVQIPVTVGFNLASGKEVKISKLSLSRAQTKFEDITRVVDNVDAVDHNNISHLFPVDVGNAENKRRKEEEASEDNWVSSPTIGKAKRSKRQKRVVDDSPRSQLTQATTPETPSFESSTVSAKIRALRRNARQEQTSIIQKKQSKGNKPSPKTGYLYRLKKDGRPKKTWKELIGSSSLPDMLAPHSLLGDYGMLSSVWLVQASNSSSFNFCAWDHFPIEECLQNSQGVQIGEFLVIFSDENTIGCEEIGASLLASENVDPSLISLEWIRNHYRWIVWKLASMEKRLPSLFARTCLTLKNVLEQLKYRYDKEIDHCQRSPLKRIIEHDDTAAKTMILCVAEIRSPGPQILELTDGWYSIEAHCDTAMQQLIERKTIFVGLKLAISCAELVSPGPSVPLEKGSDTYLKISANSTRRARWDSKLGFYSNPLPFLISLSSVLTDGGVVSHIRINVIRVYPMMYMDKAADGKTIFRGERQYRRITESAAMRFERMMEKVVEDIEREEDEQERKRIRSDGNCHHQEMNLTDEEKRSRIFAEARKRMQTNMKSIEGVPLLKLRVVDCRDLNLNSAIVSIWRPSEELQHHLKEGRSYDLYNVNAAGLRCGELQLNVMKNTVWKELKQTSASPSFHRSVTSFSTANQPGFKPMFNELDIVGLVVLVGHEQNKGPFQTAVLTDGNDNYFGVKCWVSLEEYALADVVVVGAFLAFSNLQWRPMACRTATKLQFAYIHEGTLVNSRPALKHLDVALSDLKQLVKNPMVCVTEAEGQVDTLLGRATPQSATPKYGSETSRRAGMFTPTGVIFSGDEKKNETPTSSNIVINRARLLEKYANPPSLSPWNGGASPLVRQKFKPPARKAPGI